MIWLIGLSGVCGASVRYYMALWIAARRTGKFPLATLITNLSGSLLLGMLFNLHRSGQLGDGLWLIFGVGFCGAYTTMSTFGYELMQLITDRRYRLAATYVLSSIALGLLFAWVGMTINLGAGSS
ncbi:fluoride efflux transporter CrcB [Paenibacillaceae bacterium]|nr:fluoride efflux transporter CrcB [Paenibacillaceae bacterium]